MTKEEIINRFDIEYKSKGGVKTLKHMVRELYSTQYIGDHFGVTREAVRQWLDHMFDLKYDPRTERKERIIQSMLDFAKDHTFEEFKEAYYYISRYYYDIALQEAYSRGIFKEDKG